MSMGPEATLSLLVGSSIAQQERHDSIDRLAWACLMTFLVGFFTFLLGIVRLGYLDSLMSRALLRGFITGVSLVVMLQQSIILLGLEKSSQDAGITEASSSIDRVVFLVRHIQEAHILSTCVSCASVLFLLGSRILKNRVPRLTLFPEVLLVVAITTILTWRLGWADRGLQILGEIKSTGVPLPSIPAFPSNKHLKDMLVQSAMISVIGFVESVVIAKTYSSRYNYTVSANRELVALGVANLVGGLFQSIPAFGSVSQKKESGKKGVLLGTASLIISCRSREVRSMTGLAHVPRWRR